MTNTRVVKQVRCPVSCWFFKCFIKHHRNAEPCRTGIWGWQIANASKYLTKCGICCQPYIPMFITFSRKKGRKKAIYFTLLTNQWCKKISLPPTLVFLSEFFPHAHIIPTSLQRQPVSLFLGQQLKVHAWGWGYYLGDCKVPLQRSITCQDVLKHFIQTRSNKRDHPPLHKSQMEKSSPI